MIRCRVSEIKILANQLIDEVTIRSIPISNMALRVDQSETRTERTCCKSETFPSVIESVIVHVKQILDQNIRRMISGFYILRLILHTRENVAFGERRMKRNEVEFDRVR